MSKRTEIWVGTGFLTKAIDGVLTPEYITFSASQTANKHPFNGFGSDNLPGGVNGIFNHADKRRYDSKSAYTRAVRAAGCSIVGNDFNNQNLTRKQIAGDFNVRQALTLATQRVLHGH